MRNESAGKFHKVLYFMLLLGILVSLTGAGDINTASARGERPILLLETDQYKPLISNRLFLSASNNIPFDMQNFLNSQQGPLKDCSEIIDGESWTAAESIEYNAIFYGINPQILLVLLEAKGELVSNSNSKIPMQEPTTDETQDSEKFYYYVKWLAEATAAPFYAWRDHRDNGNVVFASGETLNVPENLNAGTYGLQAALAKIIPVKQWKNWVSGNMPLFKLFFASKFGVDPMVGADASTKNINATPLPANFSLPFPVGETWYYTSGPHNYVSGTIGCVSGSGCPRPWSSIDIAPPESIPCPGGAYPANRWIVAAQGGTLSTPKKALVVIDHGNGWKTYYSHVATKDKHTEGSIKEYEHIGHPSCEVEPGGKTYGVHVHFAIWQSDNGFVNISGSSLSGWKIQETTHYNGTMTRQGVTRTADTGRGAGVNDILNSGSEPGGFNSTFTSSASGWKSLIGIWNVNTTSGWYFTSGAPRMFWHTVRHINNYPTLTYEVRMKRTVCSWCANHIAIRGTPGARNPNGLWKNVYVFEYQNRSWLNYSLGAWSVFEVNDGVSQVLVGWTPSSYIRPYNWNTLKVTSQGSTFNFYINGHLVWSGTDTSLVNGLVGIGMYQDYTYATMGTLYVDWAKLSPRVLTSSSEANLPSAEPNSGADINGFPEP